MGDRPAGGLTKGKPRLPKWKFGAADQYLVWNTDSSDNFTDNATAIVPAADLAIQEAELTFLQDLNGDTTTGPMLSLIHI